MSSFNGNISMPAVGSKRPIDEGEKISQSYMNLEELLLLGNVQQLETTYQLPSQKGEYLLEVTTSDSPNMLSYGISEETKKQKVEASSTHDDESMSIGDGKNKLYYYLLLLIRTRPMFTIIGR